MVTKGFVTMVASCLRVRFNDKRKRKKKKSTVHYYDSFSSEMLSFFLNYEYDIITILGWSVL